MDFYLNQDSPACQYEVLLEKLWTLVFATPVMLAYP